MVSRRLWFSPALRRGSSHPKSAGLARCLQSRLPVDLPLRSASTMTKIQPNRTLSVPAISAWSMVRLQLALRQWFGRRADSLFRRQLCADHYAKWAAGGRSNGLLWDPPYSRSGVRGRPILRISACHTLCLSTEPMPLVAVRFYAVKRAQAEHGRR